MANKRRLLTAIVVALFAGAFSIGFAEEPLRGPLPESQRALIHQMAAGHDKIVREVELTERGYIASTTSVDAELALAIQKHFAYMQKRMGAGSMVRRWDPAFVEMVEHHPDIDITGRKIEGGIAVNVEGQTDAAIKVAQNHAGIISEFVKTGELYEKHARALP